MRAFHVALLGFGFVGLGLERRRLAAEPYLPLLLASWIALHVATFATPRYLLPMMPIIGIFAARAVGGGLNLAVLLAARSPAAPA